MALIGTTTLQVATSLRLATIAGPVAASAMAPVRPVIILASERVSIPPRGYGVPVGPNAASILRRYEFYEFSGMYDPETHEAQFEPPYGDSNPGPTDVGFYLGSQNAAANLVIPEPHTLIMLASGLALVLTIRHRK
jgi:hypothetical protein